MKNLIIQLLPIIYILLVVVATALFVHIQSPGKSAVKLLVVPTALIALLVTPFLFVKLMGYSVALPLPDKFDFIAYTLIIESGRKAEIEVWLKEGNTTRLQRAPYSKEFEEVLEEAAKGQKAGRTARLSKKPGKPQQYGQEQNDDQPGGYELRFQLPAPKDTPPDQ